MITTKIKRIPRGTLLAHKRLELDTEIYKQVIEIVANEFGLPVSKMICRRRNFELVMARNMAFYMMDAYNNCLLFARTYQPLICLHQSELNHQNYNI